MNFLLDRRRRRCRRRRLLLKRRRARRRLGDDGRLYLVQRSVLKMVVVVVVVVMVVGSLWGLGMTVQEVVTAGVATVHVGQGGGGGGRTYPTPGILVFETAAPHGGGRGEKGVGGTLVVAAAQSSQRSRRPERRLYVLVAHPGYPRPGLRQGDEIAVQRAGGIVRGRQLLGSQWRDPHRQSRQW